MRHRMPRYGLLAVIVFLCGGCGPKDGGATWTAVREFKAPLRASCFVDAETGWLVGENGWIVKIASDIRDSR